MDKKIIEMQIREKALRDIDIEEKMIIHHSHFELLKEEHERMSSLAHRIYNSLSGEIEEFNVATVLLNKNEYKIYEKEFTPIFNKDFNDDILSILKQIKYERKTIYKTIFLNMNYENIEKLDIKFINGEILVNGNKYIVKFELEKENKFIEKIKEIYEVTQLNKLKWKNIYCPYAYKAYSLRLVEIPEDLEKILNNIERVELKINYPDEIKENVIEKVLCWNIKEDIKIPKILVRPTKEIIYYEHILEKIEENILVGKEIINFEFLYKDNENIRIITSDEKYEKIKIYLINNIFSETLEKLEIFRNHKEYQYIKNERRETVLIFRSIEEVNNYIKLYPIFKNYKIKSLGNKNDNIIKTYDLEISKRNEFSIKNKKNNLYFKMDYEKNERENDVLSYMKAELEQYFVDFNCIFVE